MSDVVKHYQHLLAEHYLWMFGISFEQKVAEQKAILEQALGSLSSAPRSGLAIDLGSGPGFQTIALAELGYAPVIAIDTSRELLAELRAHSGSHAVETREADLSSLNSIAVSGKASVIVCMGDTLTHLPSKAAVQELFRVLEGKLAPGGLFILTYRDLTGELYGTDRFLPVQADDSKIMTCFLEYKNADSVVVSDLVYVREETGWKLNKSSYEKLRLASAWVSQTLREADFEIECERPVGRMLMLIAKKF